VPDFHFSVCILTANGTNYTNFWFLLPDFFQHFSLSAFAALRQWHHSKKE